MKILLIASTTDVFGRGLKCELVKKKMDVSLLDFETLTLIDKEEKIVDKYAKLHSKFKFIIKFNMFFRLWLIKKVIQEAGADIVNIHVSRWFYLMILPWISRSGLIVTFYGSDFYRTTGWVKRLQTILYIKANALTFTNPVTRLSFLEFYKDFSYKSYVCRFGLEALDFIDKHKGARKIDLKNNIGFSTKKIVVTCGYNSTKSQQHERIIGAILKLPSNVLEKFQFVFPLTYGDNSQRLKVKEVLKSTDLDYICLENFLYSDDNAYTKMASDIMINVLETDSFSGSMQEYLYANNVVITGDWLPYEVFDKAGLKYIKISDFDEVTMWLMNFAEFGVNNFDTAGNDEIIGILSRWDSVIDSWLSVYEEVFQSSVVGVNL